MTEQPEERLAAAEEALTNALRRNEKLRVALGAYRSALRSGEPESDQLRAVGDAALSAAAEGATESWKPPTDRFGL